MPWTFAGVIVSTVPTSSPVAGLNDSSAGFGLPFAFDRFGEDFVVLSPFELDFRLAPVLRVPLASITASSRRLRSSRSILRGANTSSQRWEETAYGQRPPAEAAPPSYPCACLRKIEGREQSPSSRPSVSTPRLLTRRLRRTNVDCQSVRQRSEHGLLRNVAQ